MRAAPPSALDAHDAPASPSEGRVEFDDIRFAYPSRNATEVLRGVSIQEGLAGRLLDKGMANALKGLEHRSECVPLEGMALYRDQNVKRTVIIDNAHCQ